MLAQWLLTETLSMLLHLEVTGQAVRIAGEPERWTAVGVAGTAGTEGGGRGGGVKGM